MKIVGEALSSKINPRNTVDAQFSVYFQVATALLDGKVEWSSYERLGSADVVGLAKRIRTHVDPAMKKAGASLVVELDGTVMSITIEDPLGEPERPLGWDGLKAKFLSLAEPVYGAAHASQIEAFVKEMGPDHRMGRGIKLLRTK
jgi:2-methylcitrate dehydratase PrpD